MKVCHLLNTAGTGGAETLTLELIRRTDPEAVTYTVCYIGGPHVLVPKYREAGARVVNLNSRTRKPQLDPSIIPKLFTLLREEEFDILHGHMPYTQVLARLAANYLVDSEIVSTYHTPQDNLPTVSKTLVSATESLDSASVAVSDGVRRSYSNNPLPQSEEQWCTIYNGISIEDFNNDVKSEVPTPATDAEGPVFLNVGRSTPQKGQEYLIKAMAYVTEELPDSRAIIVGSGPCQDELEELVENLELGDSVTIAGEDPEIKKYYALADVFVFSSLVEGLPITGLEAMAAELPIVGTRVPGVEEVVVDGQTGYLVPPRSPEELAEAMLQLKSEQKRQQMGQQGFKRGKNHFNIENTVRNYLGLYRNITKGENIVFNYNN